MKGLAGQLRGPQTLTLAISRTIIRLEPSSHITVMRSNSRAASSGVAAACICRVVLGFWVLGLRLNPIASAGSNPVTDACFFF